MGAVVFPISIAAIECPKQFADWCCWGRAWVGLRSSWSCRARIVFVYSFFERGTYGGIDYVFTLENYARAVDPLYLSILLTSARVAVITTLAALADRLSGRLC